MDQEMCVDAAGLAAEIENKLLSKQALSAQRAAGVAAWLTAHGDTPRLTSQGFKIRTGSSFSTVGGGR